MQITIEIPDTLLEEARAAMRKLNDRRAADQREAVAFDADWARECLLARISAILIAEFNESAVSDQNAAAAAIQKHVRDVGRGA
jgi:hypothetical protein